MPSNAQCYLTLGLAILAYDLVGHLVYDLLQMLRKPVILYLESSLSQEEYAIEKGLKYIIGDRSIK